MNKSLEHMRVSAGRALIAIATPSMREKGFLPPLIHLKITEAFHKGKRFCAELR